MFLRKESNMFQYNRFYGLNLQLFCIKWEQIRQKCFITIDFFLETAFKQQKKFCNYFSARIGNFKLNETTFPQLKYHKNSNYRKNFQKKILYTGVQVLLYTLENKIHLYTIKMSYRTNSN